MPTELVHSTGARVAGPSGIVIPFIANTPKLVHEDLMPFCLAAGCYPVDGFKKAATNIAPKAKETFKEIDPLLIIALMEILDSGDKAKLTTAGMPRHAMVKEIYGSEVSVPMIEAAMGQIAKTDAA